MTEGRGILITRPEPGATETAARVAALGHRPILAPLLVVQSRNVPLPTPDRVQAILVTSGNAIPSLHDSHRRVPLLAVGEATAARARAAGFTRVRSADGDASGLAALVANCCDPGGDPLLLVSGRGQGQGLASALRDRGFRVVRRTVYAAIPAGSLPDHARDAIGNGTVQTVLLFSAETARQCVRLLREARLRDAVRAIEALAISQPTAMALRALPWRRIRVADRPNQDALLAMLP
ncbi:MAG TPA: uroporphyrinogen-III synthase [Acetobacteraceae bacterium]|nr:uroporphyrinogen-III synthase [Acetobacteraceae bacterium]